MVLPTREFKGRVPSATHQFRRTNDVMHHLIQKQINQDTSNGCNSSNLIKM